MRNGYYYYFHRLGFLLNILQRYGSLTREEISNLWLDDINSDGVPISTRTIQRSFTAIRELYGMAQWKKLGADNCVKEEIRIFAP